MFVISRAFETFYNLYVIIIRSLNKQKFCSRRIVCTTRCGGCTHSWPLFSLTFFLLFLSFFLTCTAFHPLRVTQEADFLRVLNPQPQLEGIYIKKHFLFKLKIMETDFPGWVFFCFLQPMFIRRYLD